MWQCEVLISHVAAVITKVKGEQMITENQWLEYYEPIEDVANGTDLWDTDDPIISVIKPNHIWTLCDDGENGYILPGYCFVNRIGYYITKKPFDPVADKDLNIHCYKCGSDPE